MSDEERIARLTELARQVWPDLERPRVWAEPDDMEPGMSCAALDDEGLEYIHVHPHPRALDMLEAALVVGAAEERVPLTERRVLEDRIASLERDRDALLRRYKAKARVVPVLPVDPDAEREVGELIARSSVGAGLRRLRTDPETELTALDEELTPEVMQQIIALSSEPPAWVEKLAEKWARIAQGLSDEGWPAPAFDRCARELRAAAKGGEPCE